jgi:assimilatory nitrate reductase catalytic subunit
LVREALQAADYVVVQEAYANTDTTDYADLLLPASAWGEKHGTVTNSERCISRVLPAVAPPGEARHDWQIVVDFARRLGQKLHHAGAERLFPYADAEAIFNEHRATTRGRDLDITGLSYALLETAGPQQWPYPAGATGGKQRLYEDGCFPTADGRARFVAIEHLPTADRHLPETPISLISGRLRDHWHGMSRTGTVPRLFNLEDEPLLGMHPCDMRHRALENGDLVSVSNGRGAITVRVAEQSGLQRGRAWMPMHWGSQFMNSAGVNVLACDATDPYSKQPELKHATVQISKLALPYPLAIIRVCSDQAAALDLMQRARAALTWFPYATLSLYGRSSPLVVFRAATATAMAPELLSEMDALFGLDTQEGAIVFADASRSVNKKAINANGRLLAVRLAGEALAQSWLKKAMAEDELAASLLRFALAPSAKPPLSIAPRNIICKCADISDVQIRQALASGADLSQLQERFKCGTFCGSCLPEIKRMVASRDTPAMAVL